MRENDEYKNRYPNVETWEIRGLFFSARGVNLNNTQPTFLKKCSKNT